MHSSEKRVPGFTKRCLKQHREFIESDRKVIVGYWKAAIEASDAGDFSTERDCSYLAEQYTNDLAEMAMKLADVVEDLYDEFEELGIDPNCLQLRH